MKIDYEIQEVIEELNIRSVIIGWGSRTFNHPSSLRNAEKESITFCENKCDEIKNCKSSVIVTTYAIFHSLEANEKKIGTTFVIVENPRLEFVKIVKKCFPKLEHSGIHPSAIVDKSTIIGKNVNIYPYCTIGFEGFGHYTDEENKLRRFPHLGKVIIGDDVDIFPFTNVDKGALEPTRIGNGTKIDHHCHIGHGVKIGKNCIITAGVIIAGSTIVGDHVYIGIGSVIRDWIEIESNSYIGMGSVVVDNVKKGELVYGNPARPIPRKEEKIFNDKQIF